MIINKEDFKARRIGLSKIYIRLLYKSNNKVEVNDISEDSSIIEGGVYNREFKLNYLSILFEYILK